MRCGCLAGEQNLTRGLVGRIKGGRLRVRNEGNAGRKGGPPGDLYVFIRVKKHPHLRREGTTIHADVKIPYVDAILGTVVQVPPFSPPQTFCPLQQIRERKIYCQSRNLMTKLSKPIHL